MPEVLTLRRGVLHLSISLMEAAWVAPLAILFVPPLQHPPFWTIILSLWAVVSLYALLARRVLLAPWSSNTVYALLFLIPIASYLIAARLLLFSAHSVLSLTWLAPALTRPLYLLRPGPELGLLLTVALAWWRALDVAQLPDRIAVLAFRFRVEILVLVVGLVVLATTVGREGLTAVWTFFFASLMALALVRVEEVGDLEGAQGRVFDRSWTALILASTVVIVGSSALLAKVVTFENAVRVFNVARPVLRVVGLALFFILVTIGWLIARIVLWLIHLLTANVEIHINFSPLQIPEAPKQAPPAPWRVESPWFTWLAQHMEQVAGAAAITFILLLIALGVRREVRQRRLAREEEMAAGSMGEVAADIGQGLRGLWEQIKGIARLLRLYGPRSEFLAALSVHNIYVNLLRLTAQKGVLRRKAETPYEHLSRLTARFPVIAQDARAITDAFVAAHYGELAVDAEDLARLRQAWERIREHLRE